MNKLLVLILSALLATPISIQSQGVISSAVQTAGKDIQAVEAFGSVKVTVACQKKGQPVDCPEGFRFSVTLSENAPRDATKRILEKNGPVYETVFEKVVLGSYNLKKDYNQHHWRLNGDIAGVSVVPGVQTEVALSVQNNDLGAIIKWVTIGVVLVGMVGFHMQISKKRA